MDIIDSAIKSYSIRDQLILNFYYIQSLIKTSTIKMVYEKTKSIQNEFSWTQLELLDKIIFYTIIIIGLRHTGNFSEEIAMYNEGSEFVKANSNELSNSRENFWYQYFNLVSAELEIKQKHFSLAYDILKHSFKHFLNITNKSQSDKLMLANISLNLGQLHKQTNYLDIAIHNFKTAIEWSLNAKNLEYTRSSYLNLSLTYEEQAKEYLAIQTGKELLDQIEKKFDGDQYSFSSANNLIGNIYNRMGEFEQAKDYYLRAFSVLTDLELIGKIKSFNFNNLGVISFKLGDYSEALTYFSQALELAKSKQNPTELSFYYANIGEAYLELGYLDDALENELHALTFLKMLNNDDLLVETYFILVRICLEKNDFEKTDHYINEIQNLSLKTKRNVYELKFSLSKAIKLKKQLKYEESKAIFLTILENPYLSFDLKTIALTELAGLLLYSVLKYNASNYEDLEKISLRLMTLGKQKKSLPVICNLAILLSRIKLLSNKFQEAENILEEANNLCIEKNVSYFKNKIEEEIEFCTELKQLNLMNPQFGKGMLIERFGSSKALKNMRDLQRLMLSGD